MDSLILNQLMQVISYDRFKKNVNLYSGDKWSKNFSCWKQFKVMLYYHMSGASTLRNVVSSLRSSANKLFHLGVEAISLNNISHANKKRDSRIFEKTFYQLKSQLESYENNCKRKFRFKNQLLAVDSTVISLCLSLCRWAKFRSTKAGIKLHTEIDVINLVPGNISITNANVHDSKAFQEHKIKQQAIYILDRAYCDTKALYLLVKNAAYFVTRLKKNWTYQILERKKVTPELKKTGVKTDWLIRFKGDKSANYPEEVRLVRFRDPETGKRFEFLTNLKHLSARTIADIYKQRWQVELFFKAIKQNLKIKHFVGFTENAVRIQIWTGLIVYLLFKWHQFVSKFKAGFTEYIAILKPNLLNGGNLWSLFDLGNYTDLARKLRLRKTRSTQGSLF